MLGFDGAFDEDTHTDEDFDFDTVEEYLRELEFPLYEGDDGA